MGQETTSVVLVTFEVWGLTEMGENYTSSKVGWRVGLVLGKKKGSNSHVTFAQGQFWLQRWVWAQWTACVQRNTVLAEMADGLP